MRRRPARPSRASAVRIIRHRHPSPCRDRPVRLAGRRGDATSQHDCGTACTAASVPSAKRKRRRRSKEHAAGKCKRAIGASDDACPRARQRAASVAWRRGRAMSRARAVWHSGDRRVSSTGREPMTASPSTRDARGTGRCRHFARPMRRRTRRSRRACSPRRRASRPPRRASTRARRASSRRSARAAGGLGGIEDFLREYSLSTKEGLALMVLAEALLRVPDAATADRLIEDKLAAGDWTHHEVKSDALLVSASAWALGISARIIQPGETPENILDTLGKRLGLPAVRTATRQAMRLLGSHFVLGQTIEEALGARRARSASSATPSTCSARARAPPPTRSAISRPMRAAIEAIGPTRRQCARCRTGRASRSSSRRCIRATRRSRASACSRELTPRVLELARRRQGARSQFHRRCRGGRPARTVARRDRRGAGRSLARRLGRFRARGAGLSEARRRGDRLGRATPPRRSTAG